MRCTWTLDAGETIYQANDAGLAWRVRNGVIRLDTMNAEKEPCFASLAIAGDILGCETMFFGTYTFNALALTQCQLTPWPEGEGALSGESLLASLAISQKRAADLVALRGGQAVGRVISLIQMLTDKTGQLVLPARQDIADITDLRSETISRIIKGLERSGVLATTRINGVHLTRGYVVDFGSQKS